MYAIYIKYHAAQQYILHSTLAKTVNITRLSYQPKTICILFLINIERSFLGENDTTAAFVACFEGMNRDPVISGLKACFRLSCNI